MKIWHIFSIAQNNGLMILQRLISIHFVKKEIQIILINFSKQKSILYLDNAVNKFVWSLKYVLSNNYTYNLIRSCCEQRVGLPYPSDAMRWDYFLRLLNLFEVMCTRFQWVWNFEYSLAWHRVEISYDSIIIYSTWFEIDTIVYNLIFYIRYMIS